MHVVFQKCVNVRASNLIVTAPEKSPNTDGIHVTDTQNIQIISSVIRTGIIPEKENNAEIKNSSLNYK